MLNNGLNYFWVNIRLLPAVCKYVYLQQTLSKNEVIVMIMHRHFRNLLAATWLPFVTGQCVVLLFWALGNKYLQKLEAWELLLPAIVLGAIAFAWLVSFLASRKA